jgi:hypothetical protein
MLNNTIMKTKTLKWAVLLIIILLAIPNVAESQGKDKKSKSNKKDKSDRIMLFNGKDLKNWVFKLQDPSVDPATVFTVSDGIV